MAPPTELVVSHIESFVDTSRSPIQQATSVNDVAALLKNNSITVEELVKELELYLTTTDNILRARGILLLAEVLGCLESKPLDSTTIHFLIGFFSDRLTDWRALRGALTGCLALLSRESNVGTVTQSDAKVLLDSILQNLAVQSFGQHDRKLSFELLACFISRYPEAVAKVGDHLIYGICEAMDGEKDPECLIIGFGIVEGLARLFPDPAGPMENYAQDIYDILSSYFPIHYTHPKSEDVAVSRDDLSSALMLALSSTPFFEPFVVPLLLEKLSTSLPLAKIDSLRYLACCTVKYGPERIRNHADAIWHALKSTLFSMLPNLAQYSVGDFSNGLGFQESDITKEALFLLHRVGFELGSDFLSLILSDEDITHIRDSLSSFRSYSVISLENKQKLLGVACIISTLVKTSKTLCNKVFNTLFPHLIDNLQVTTDDGSLGTDAIAASDTDPCRLNFGSLYLCMQIIGACRNLNLSCIEPESKFYFVNEPWYLIFLNFSGILVKTFNYDLVMFRAQQYFDEVAPLRLKSLEILATFPGDFCAISKPMFEELLMALISVIHTESNVITLWKLVLKTIVQIGTSIDRDHASGKSLCYSDIVLKKIVSLMEMNDSSLPYPLILDAVNDISTTCPTFLLTIVQGTEQVILAKLSEVDENPKVVENLVQLLGLYSYKLLPRFLQNQNLEDLFSHFPIAILDLIEKSRTNGAAFVHKDLLSATMVALKLAVGGCSDKDQPVIVQKAFDVILLSDSFSCMKVPSAMVAGMFEGLQSTKDFKTFVCNDEWLLSLLSSVIIAIRPQTFIPNSRDIIWVSLTASLSGHVPSAQALGSIFNKMNLACQMEDSSCLRLEDVLDVIFKTVLGKSYKNISLGICTLDDEDDPSQNLADVSLIQIHSITALAWIGKGLLMRGHNKVKDVLMVLLRCLLSGSGLANVPDIQLEKGDGANRLLLMRSAADALYILISDSEGCLNKKFHAISGPLYKQRLFSILMPILLSSIIKCTTSWKRSVLFQAFGHIVSGAPLVAVSSESKKIVPILINALRELSEDIHNKEMVYNLLLVLSGLLMDKNVQDTIIDNLSAVVNCLTGLLSYSHKMLVRETTLQCLIAISVLPYTNVYRMRTQIIAAVSKVLDDPKRVVRQEAVRCLHAWVSLA